MRVPNVDDLIALKTMGERVRTKDEEDIHFLRVTKELQAEVAAD